MVALIIYLCGILPMFLLVSTINARVYSDRSFDIGDYMLQGIVLALVAAIWPLTIFGVLNGFIASYFKKKWTRERELERELAKG